MTRRGREQGGAGIYVLLLLSFVLFSLLVLAFDIGRLYLVQAELQTAGEAAALAAAIPLVGTTNSTIHAAEQVTAAFDSTTGNDNRFNLRMNQLGAPTSELLTEVAVDYFSTLLDAQNNVNGGQSGADAKYVRVEIRAETPVLFTRFLSPERSGRQMVAAAAIAGVSSPVCVACGIDALAIPALDTEDAENYGFALGEYYTLYLTPSQQRPNFPDCASQVPAPLEGTLVAIEYTVLNHLPAGPETGLDGELFRLAAGGMANRTGVDPPGCVVIGNAEAAKPDLQGTTCVEANLVGRDVLCGLNARFAVDPAQNDCNNIEAASELTLLFPPDADVGTDTLQNYATEYDGNLRRVLTVALVDAADTLTVLNFRQFLLQSSPNAVGLDPSGFTGVFRAQYIGRPVPIRAGTVGGSCNVAAGVGRVVLH